LGRFTRAQILERLWKQIGQKKVIIAANCSAGITAKYSEEMGADLITVHSTGKYRYLGVPYPLPNLYWGGANEMIGNVFEIYHEIDNAINNTPIICGLEAYDPLFRKTDKLIAKALEIGYDGIQNWPSWGFHKPVRRLRDEAGEGFGFEKEIRMIKMAHDMDVFTMAYSFWPDDTKRLVEAGADVIIAHCGWEVGGEIGAPESAVKMKRDWDAEEFAGQPRDLENSVVQVKRIYEAAKEANPNVIVLATGGSLTTPENCQYVADRVPIDGFEIGHAIECIAFEKYLIKVAQDFKALTMRAHPRKR